MTKKTDTEVEVAAVAKAEKPKAKEAPATVLTVDYALQFSIDNLRAMQHARATAGGGLSIPWQNAQAHIAKAIECIEQQAAADAK